MPPKQTGKKEDTSTKKTNKKTEMAKDTEIDEVSAENKSAFEDDDLAGLEFEGDTKDTKSKSKDKDEDAEMEENDKKEEKPKGGKKKDTPAKSKATTPKKDGVFKKLVIYVEVAHEEGGEAKEDSEPVKKKLEENGAKVLGKIGKTVTHIVFLNGKPTTYKKSQEKDNEIKFVSPAWVEESIKKKAIQDESKFKANAPKGKTPKKGEKATTPKSADKKGTKRKASEEAGEEGEDKKKEDEDEEGEDVKKKKKVTPAKKKAKTEEKDEEEKPAIQKSARLNELVCSPPRAVIKFSIMLLSGFVVPAMAIFFLCSSGNGPLLTGASSFSSLSVRISSSSSFFSSPSAFALPFPFFLGLFFFEFSRFFCA
jgi:hypothetical protein